MWPSTLEALPPHQTCPQAPLAGLPAICVEPGLILNLPGDGERRLSLTVATDLRNDCTLKLKDNQGHEYKLEAAYASHSQRLRLDIPAGARQVTVVEQMGEAELWIVCEGKLRPTVFKREATAAERRTRALDRLRRDAVCQFSWMGGCVLDGLTQLAEVNPESGWNDALNEWLNHFHQDGELIYQSPRGKEIRNAFCGVESTLPVTAIARRNPDSPIVDYAVSEWRRLRREDNAITDHSITAEGSYTVAYPMAVVGHARGNHELIELALQQLRIRRDRLCIGGDLYLRNLDGALSFRNWTRGICWSLLGLASTLKALGPDIDDDDLRDFAQERAGWIMAHQREDGLWDNFLDEAGQGLPPDSSGSAGIATALVIFNNIGAVDKTAITCAEACWQGLGACLEPDGMLGSVAPNNKRGEAEQHTTRRTIEPFALGLYGQLAAALSNYKT